MARHRWNSGARAREVDVCGPRFGVRTNLQTTPSALHSPPPADNLKGFAFAARRWAGALESETENRSERLPIPTFQTNRSDPFFLNGHHRRSRIGCPRPRRRRALVMHSVLWYTERHGIFLRQRIDCGPRAFGRRPVCDWDSPSERQLQAGRGCRRDRQYGRRPGSMEVEGSRRTRAGSVHHRRWAVLAGRRCVWLMLFSSRGHFFKSQSSDSLD